MSTTTARRVLRRLWAKVAVSSCSDGTLRIKPVYRKQFRNPGVLTRMYSARMVEEVLNLPVKKINWKARAKKNGR